MDLFNELAAALGIPARILLESSDSTAYSSFRLDLLQQCPSLQNDSRVIETPRSPCMNAELYPAAPIVQLVFPHADWSDRFLAQCLRGPDEAWDEIRTALHIYHPWIHDPVAVALTVEGDDVAALVLLRDRDWNCVLPHQPMVRLVLGPTTYSFDTAGPVYEPRYLAGHASGPAASQVGIPSGARRSPSKPLIFRDPDNPLHAPQPPDEPPPSGWRDRPPLL